MKINTTVLPGALALLALGSCSSEKQTVDKPNIVFILTDQWRASAFGYTGDPNVKTPNIDRFATQSVNFSNAVSVCPVSGPARACMQSGRYPTSTGFFVNDLHLPSSELCMAEIFGAQGYTTAYLGKWHLDGNGRFNNVPPDRRQGWSWWKGLECSHDYNKMPYYENDDPRIKYWEGYSPLALANEANRYISEHKDDKDPFFLFVSIGAPHFPHHTAPKEAMDLYPKDQIKIAPNVPEKKHDLVRKEIQGYYGHCTATDAAIGKIFDKIKELGMDKNTVVVFTSDHGEMMGAHGINPRIKQEAWDESIKVPFLISYPEIGDKKGSVVKAPINTPDILPTLLGMAGLKKPNTLEGEDLSGLVRHPDPEADRAAMVMTVCPNGGYHFFNTREFRGLRTSRYSYITNADGPEWLFDNEKDPYQMKNLLDDPDYAEIQAGLDKELKRQLKVIGDENFKRGDYYIKKWNIYLDPQGKCVDYWSFNEGKGSAQTPHLSKE